MYRSGRGGGGGGSIEARGFKGSGPPPPNELLKVQATMYAVACSFKLQQAYGLPQPPEEVHDPCVPMLHGGVCVHGAWRSSQHQQKGHLGDLDPLDTHGKM